MSASSTSMVAAAAAAAAPARRRPPLLGPFVWLEARRAARSGRTFVLRALVLLVLLTVVAIGLGWGTIVAHKSTASGLADLGRTSFWLYSIAQVYLVGLMAPVLGAGVITEERDQQTGGLLLLTPVRPLGLLAGKFLGKLLTLELILLAGLPVLALSLALGGVDWREAMGAALLLQLTLLPAAATGLLAASLQLSTPGSAMATYLVLGLSWWLPAIPAKLVGSPLTAMTLVLFSSGRPSWALVWPPLATSLVTTLAGLIGAALCFARFTEDTAPLRQRVRRWRVVLAGLGLGGDRRGGEHLDARHALAAADLGGGQRRLRGRIDAALDAFGAGAGHRRLPAGRDAGRADGALAGAEPAVGPGLE